MLNRLILIVRLQIFGFFFNKFEKFQRATPNTDWNPAYSVEILANLLDDQSGDFFDQLTDEVKAVYEHTKAAMIRQYEVHEDPNKLWVFLKRRKQLPFEKVTDYYNDIVRMGRKLHFPDDQLLIMFY